MEEAELEKKWTFDSDVVRGYTEVRQEFIRELLRVMREQIQLGTALDVGCGVGYFSKFLSDLGLRVVAIDGREENTREAKERYPEISFFMRNVEDPALPDIGAFDLVLCVGLVYHLENPFRAIRNLHSLTGKVLIVESMCAPGRGPSLHLVDEGEAEDQGLNYVAFYPTEACLVKMLYRAGFPFVYGFVRLPECSPFRASLWRRRERTMLLASKERLSAANLKLAPDVRGSWEILSTPRERWRIRFERMLGLTRKLGRQVSPPQDRGKG
jgi:tRNA (mo5U34)-methyltransferase